MRTSDFLDTPRGQLARYNWRWRHRLRLLVRGIEPRGKRSMPPNEKLEFQQQVVEQMRVSRRQPFRRGVAVDIALSTSALTPAHVQTVVKNVLDLLGAPSAATQRSIGTRRRGLLYYDDAQVEALSVSSVRTKGTPLIAITAVSLCEFLEDLGLAARAELDYSEWNERRSRNEALEKFADWRELCTENSPLAEDVAASLQAEAQREWLQPHPRYLWVLAQLFSAPTMPMWAWPVRRSQAGRDSDGSLRKLADRHFQDPMLRIVFGELPHQPGTSARFRAQVTEQLEQFQARYRWILHPLRIPVGLDVVVKPPPARAGSHGRHDLDNVVRDYILPRAATLFAVTGQERDVTSGERPGISQYRAWRLPRHDNDDTPGYVSVGVTAAYARFHGSLYDQIDSAMAIVERDADCRD